MIDLAIVFGIVIATLALSKIFQFLMEAFGWIVHEYEQYDDKF